ncbi:MAG: putative homoserine kinase type (protein kinase fold)-like protein [Paenibacillus sp.]|jgi:Ser/Thr protein kinase RdoA (MazF antagonist)|nr:putative homoserine kinase type (protein kinase fold)-like protein [Paenibacillus sp.]
MGTSGHLTNDVLFAVKHLSDWFPIGKLKGIGRKLGGAYNLNIKIETSEGEYVVRILNRSNTVEHLRYIQQMLEVLTAKGVPVLNPVLTADGDSFIQYKEKLLQVTPYVRAEAFKCLPNQVCANARMLSAFHQALEHSPSGPEPAWSFYRPSDYYSDALDSLKSRPDIPRYQLYKVEKLAESILETWENSQAGLPDSVLHGDWHFWNQLYKKGEVCRIMDFDFIQQGKRIHDIAYSLWAIYILLPEYSKVFDSLFIKEYANLTDEEVRILPVAIARVGLFFLCQSAGAAQPAEKWHKHVRRQLPLIQWLLTDGERRMYELVHGKKDEEQKLDNILKLK